MSSQPSEHVSLPSIHEMFPEHLMALPPRRKYRAPPPSRPLPPHAAVPTPVCSISGLLEDSLQPTAQTGPRPPSRVPKTARRADEERKHACPTCSKAFNRPSSLAIHINTHTGAKPFECSFPGCGRRFNVNSNMRRHLRNHTPPTRQFSIASPYTHPLTMVPRVSPFPGASGFAGSTYLPVSYPTRHRSSDTGSDEDELSEPEQWGHERELAEGVDRLRFRARSTSSAASSPHVQRASPPYPSRIGSYATLGCRDYARPMTRHASS
ncbi:uncharacterized protein PHACADRAFT_112933 [Phanerochaete carnosa HHB-10118-sp]|uniref:C2H2-type domain-containing protein n=1 Tax=Phanerochaete carnosa (strain HHB-10118-sp) TaxID=650164 RepID=K5WIB8_PHACS|nr:uncharacterized protein PHACADRAFT_112933 [Phanerochaete carnosa HHB-10118-sp]EKM58824.1 hypothetical protein PHACADRAFT_112933 [Phanerochaete carnosa HHB-10118-sp]